MSSDKLKKTGLPYRLILILSILLSGGGVVIAACSKTSEGGRGGALTVALSFWVLFVRKNYGLGVYEARTGFLRDMEKELKSEDQPQILTEDHCKEDLNNLKLHVASIANWLYVEADGQNNQNRVLAWSSLIGTLV
jgi:hypothetical protein